MNASKSYLPRDLFIEDYSPVCSIGFHSGAHPKKHGGGEGEPWAICQAVAGDIHAHTNYMVLDCRGKSENLEETHPITGRPSKFQIHTQQRQNLSPHRSSNTEIVTP